MSVQVTGMFLFAGYQQAIIKTEGEVEERIKVAINGAGEREVAYYLEQYAPLVQGVADITFAFDEASSGVENDYYGIWEYEVAEALGAWLVDYAAEHDQAPPDQHWIEATAQLTYALIYPELKQPIIPE